MLVGIDGLSGRGAAAAKAAMAATHATRDRIDVGHSLSGRVKEAVSEGVTPLILYSPQFAGLSTSTIKSDIGNLAAEMKPLGLTEIEVGNEVYYGNGYNPTEYAAQYKAAHEALAGTGIKALADLYGDIGSSRVEGGGGWAVLMVNAMGFTPDGWTLHPYGGMTERNLGETEGWLIVPAMIEWLKKDGIYAPLHVTEVGQPVWTGTDGRASVTQAEQAVDAHQYVRDCAKWGCAELDWFGLADSTEPGGGSEGGYGLYTYHLEARPSAAAFGSAVAGL